MHFPLEDISKAVAHYQISLQEKKDKAVAQDKDPENVYQNYPWLKMCLEGKWYLTKYTPKQKVRSEVEKMKILIAKVRSFTTENKHIHFTKLISTPGKPLYTINQFENVPSLHKSIHGAWTRLTEETRKEIYTLAAKYFKAERKNDIGNQDPVVHDKDSGLNKLQIAITVAHTNFL